MSSRPDGCERGQPAASAVEALGAGAWESRKQRGATPSAQARLFAPRSVAGFPMAVAAMRLSAQAHFPTTTKETNAARTARAATAHSIEVT